MQRSFIIQKLKDENLLDDFKIMSSEVRKGNSISKTSKELNKYLEFGLLEHIEDDDYRDDYAEFRLTSDGDDLLRELRKM